ncbi:MAG: hypothetical protein ACYS4W_07720 [Planctomycetota bacterium]
MKIGKRGEAALPWARVAVTAEAAEKMGLKRLPRVWVGWKNGSANDCQKQRVFSGEADTQSGGFLDFRPTPVYSLASNIYSRAQNTGLCLNFGDGSAA